MDPRKMRAERRNTLLRACRVLLSAYCVALNASLAFAQATNGSITVMDEVMIAGGGRAGSGNPMSALLVIGSPVGGASVNTSFMVRTGSGASQAPSGGHRLVTIAGTVSDPAASIVVNGIPATVTQSTFQTGGVMLAEGENVITATATDTAGNHASQSICVYLHTLPPARPTVAATPAVVTQTSRTLTGTKTPGASIWINDTQVVPSDGATTWSANITLQEGDNVLVITARDAVGNVSTAHTVTIVVDALPPVITASTPAKTNFTPLILGGTVDDSLTTVTVNDAPASRSGRAFEVSVPLLMGSNTVTITATSPNGFVSTKTLAVIRGAIPAISAIQPADGTKLFPGASLTLAATATDQEGDPMEYRFLLAGQVVAGWGAGAFLPWTPTEAQRGSRLIEVQVRDGFGGVASKQAEVFVLRKPVSPP